MKQKNLAMLGVAVGCGLVAAVAVAKLSAGGSRGPETAKVLVAKKDLPLQTKLDEKEIDNLLAWADMPKNLVPPDAATDLEQVKGKSLNRTLKQGNPVSITDVSEQKGLVLPDGCKAITVKCTSVDAVSGFAKPGAKVDLMYVERTGTGKTRAAIIQKDMLVLALNMINTLDEKTGAAIPQVESVTLAVNDKQATLVTLADEKGKLKLLLRNQTKTEIGKQLADGEIEWLVDPLDPQVAPVVVAPPIAPPKMDQIVVARKTVPLNTLINADNVTEFFSTVEVKTAPEGVVQNADDLKGRYVVKSVEAGQFLFKSLTGSEMAKVEKTPEPPAVTPMTTPAPPPMVVEKKKFPRFDQVIQEGGQTKKVIWLEVAPEKWKRFDTEKEVEEFKPNADAPKTDDKAEGQKADQ